MIKIKQSLIKLFERHRIVFWYDDKGELRDRFRRLEMDGVEKIEVNRNAFTLKYEILRRYPEKKFLLYFPEPEPPLRQNWLLDVQLAYGQFRTLPLALWMAELELDPVLEAPLTPFAGFFEDRQRRDRLKKHLKPGDTFTEVCNKMLSAAVLSPPGFDSVLEQLLEEVATGKNQKITAVRNSGLETILWEQLEQTYGYRSQSPSLDDFALSLFTYVFDKTAGPSAGTTSPATLSDEVFIFLNRWKENARGREIFQTFSRRYQEQLNIPARVRDVDFRVFRDLDLYPAVDERVIEQLVEQITRGVISGADCQEIISHRRQGSWFSKYRSHYNALTDACRFFDILERLQLTAESFNGGVERYSGSWYQVDLLHRKFFFHLHSDDVSPVFRELISKIQDRYREFIVDINRKWQKCINAAVTWNEPGKLYQKNFFQSRVKPFLDKNHKVCVIVSPALRYEVAHQLIARLNREGGYKTELEAAVAVIPVKRPMGMAALLPHDQIKSVTGSKPEVMVDGKPASGIGNWKKILCGYPRRKGTALTAAQLLEMDKEKRRALLKSHQLIYIYHSPGNTRIEKWPRPGTSAVKIFKEAEDAIETLTNVAKKLLHDGAANLLVTSAAGFLHEPLDPEDGTKRGTALQEAVVPVIHINKKRSQDIAPVEIEILNGSSGIITSHEVTVSFLQVQAVDDRNLPREVIAGIYTEAGHSISNTHRMVFDNPSPNERERVMKKTFRLKRESVHANNCTVFLKVSSNVEKTTRYEVYKSRPLILRLIYSDDSDLTSSKVSGASTKIEE